MPTAAEYKRRADEARMLAGRTQDVWEREALLRVAEQWRVLAAHKASKESEANSLIESQLAVFQNRNTPSLRETWVSRSS